MNAQVGSVRATETYAGGAGGAFLGLVQWALTTYAFHGSEPAPVTFAVYAILPVVGGALAAFFTRRDAKLPEPPSAPAEPAAPAV